MNDTVTVLLKE